MRENPEKPGSGKQQELPPSTCCIEAQFTYWEQVDCMKTRSLNWPDRQSDPRRPFSRQPVRAAACQQENQWKLAKPVLVTQGQQLEPILDTWLATSRFISVMS